MTAAAARLVAEAEHTRAELPAEPWVFGVVGFALLVALLFVTLTFGKDR